MASSTRTTHQILVDAGEATRSTWGGEIGLRSRLERVYATEKGVPVILLVVQGGIGTLDTMLASAEVGCPLLVLCDSGGAASAVSEYCGVTGTSADGGIDNVEDPTFAALETKAQRARRAPPGSRRHAALLLPPAGRGLAEQYVDGDPRLPLPHARSCSTAGRGRSLRTRRRPTPPR